MSRFRYRGLILALIGLLGVILPPATRVAGQAAAPAPKTPIKHLIMMMQENHSFDNYFGTYPGADGIPANTCMPFDPTGEQSTTCVRPYHLDNPALRVPANSSRTFARQYNGGQMDGFISALRQAGRDTPAVMGYFTDDDVPFYWNLADQYVLFDRFFSAGNGGSVQNHLYWVAASPGGADEQIPTEGWGDLPTIFDRLEAQGISWKFYVEDYDAEMTFERPAGVGRTSQVVRVPLLAFARYVHDPAMMSHIADLNTYYDDLRKGTLPAVSYVVAAGSSEQPPAPLHAGQRLVKGLLNALMQSTAWDSSAFVLTYDQSGGWYDHVAPPRVDANGYGFRVPALLVSPYARAGQVDHTQLDVTSLLRFIEDNYGLPSLTARDAQAQSILGAFDFSQPPRPPVIVAMTRPAPPAPEPRRAAIFGMYGGALLGATLIIAWAALRTRRPRRRIAVRAPRPSQDGAA
jgi:phospholipase C